MDTARIYIKLSDLMETRDDDPALKALIARELSNMAVVMDQDVTIFVNMVPDVFDYIREQTAKFSSGRGTRYPPPNVNVLSIVINLPVRGKVKGHEWSSKAEV